MTLRDSLIAVVTVVVAVPAARADRAQALCATSGASVEYTLQGRGGGFEVPVSPKTITLFHFPEPITGAFPPNQRDYSVNVMSRSIAVLPLRDSSGVLNVDTKTFHVSVTLKPAAEDKAKAQVIFTSASAEAQLEAEVERRLAPLREELAGQASARTRRRVSAALLDSFAARAMKGYIARTDDNIILRVTRAITIGDDLFVHVSVENRSSRAFLVSSAKLVQAHREVATDATFETAAEDPMFVGVVPKGTTGRGILAVKGADVKAGQPVNVVLSDEDKSILTVAGVRLE